MKEEGMKKGQGMKAGFFAAMVAAVMMVGGFGVEQADASETFRIAITQAKMGAARKYRPLESYMKDKGIDVQFVAAKDYPAAARMFDEGDVDAMFCGSGVAGSMIIKDLAYPLLRPKSKAGHSTYWAVVIAPKGNEKFDGNAEYFKGKKVLASPLASSGEFYYRSIPDIEGQGQLLYASSHGSAVDALAKGAADAAVVKNWVWESMKDQYPQLELVGQDRGENPDGTLIVAKKADKDLVEKVGSVLFGINEDQSPAADAVREKMDMTVFIETTKEDFQHTLSLLREAGVDEGFNFRF